jgi:hypothetical protein
MVYFLAQITAVSFIPDRFKNLSGIKIKRKAGITIGEKLKPFASKKIT